MGVLERVSVFVFGGAELAVCGVAPAWVVDASMSSRRPMVCDFLLPGCSIDDHCPVDDVDEVALEDAAGSAFAFGCGSS
ncbi:hypothetical protein ACWDRB_67570 [Nonomuraea sp. NPDC003707]